MLPNVQIFIQQMGIEVQFNKGWRLRNTILQNVCLMLWNSSYSTNLQIIEWAWGTNKPSFISRGVASPYLWQNKMQWTYRNLTGISYRKFHRKKTIVKSRIELRDLQGKKLSAVYRWLYDTCITHLFEKLLAFAFHQNVQWLATQFLPTLDANCNCLSFWTLYPKTPNPENPCT